MSHHLKPDFLLSDGVVCVVIEQERAAIFVIDALWCCALTLCQPRDGAICNLFIYLLFCGEFIASTEKWLTK